MDRRESRDWESARVGSADEFASFPVHPPFTFEGEGTEGTAYIDESEGNGRVPFGT